MSKSKIMGIGFLIWLAIYVYMSLPCSVKINDVVTGNYILKTHRFGANLLIIESEKPIWAWQLYALKELPLSEKDLQPTLTIDNKKYEGLSLDLKQDRPLIIPVTSNDQIMSVIDYYKFKQNIKNKEFKISVYPILAQEGTQTYEFFKRLCFH